MASIPFTSALPRVRRQWKVMHAKKGWHVAIRIAEWTIASIAALWLIYIVAANVALGSQWAKNKANSSPETLQVDYASAWTIVPGIVHMTRVAGYGQFTGLEYEGQIDHLRINVGMLALMHHRVVLDIHARGVALQGKSPKSVKPADPVIDAPVPLHPVAAPPVPVVDESLATWTIQVKLEISDGRELWVDALRYEGPLTAKGSMSTTPNRSFGIKHFAVEADGGKVFVGEKTAFPRLMARIDVMLAPVDPRAVDVGAFSRLTVDTTLGGTIGDMRFVQDVAKLPILFAGDGGSFGVRARLDHGQLAAPGMARVSNQGIWVGFAGTGVYGAVEAEANLEPSVDGPVAKLTAQVTRGAVTTAKGEEFVSVPVTRSHATATHLNFADSKRMRFVFDAHAPSAVIPRLAVLNRFITSPSVKVTDGTASGSADIDGDFPKGALKGELVVTSGSLAMVLDETKIEARIGGKVPLNRASSQSDFVLTGTTAHVEDASLDNGDSHTRKWWGMAELPNGRMHFKNGPRYIGSIHASFRDIDPVITAIRKLHGIPEWVNKMLGIGPYNVDALGVLGKQTKIDLIDARANAMRFPSTPHTRVRATYDGTRDPATWRTDIEFGILALGLEKSRHLSIHPFDVANWFDRAAGLR